MMKITMKLNDVIFVCSRDLMKTCGTSKHVNIGIHTSKQQFSYTPKKKLFYDHCMVLAGYATTESNMLLIVLNTQLYIAT